MQIKLDDTGRNARDFERLILARARAGDHRGAEMITQAKMESRMFGESPLMELAALVQNDRELHDVMRDPLRAERIAEARKTIAAGTLTDNTWAGPLAALATLQSAWFASLRNFSMLDALAANGMMYAPVGRKFPITAAIGTGYSVTEATWKNVTKFSFEGATTESMKAMCLVIVANDLLKFGDSLASNAIMAQLRNVVATSADLAVTAVLIDTLTPIASVGAAREDIRRALAAVNLGQTSRPIIFAAPALVHQMALEGEAYGAPAFPDLTLTGGSISGVPVLAIDALHNYLTLGDCLIVVDAAQLAGTPGNIDITAAASASISMTGSESGSSATTLVSMFQTDSTALRAERWFNVERVRTTAVAIVDHCSYGSGSSPA